MSLEPKYKFSIAIPVRFGDLDAFGHVNNAKYLTYFEEARMAYWVNLFPLDYNNLKSLGLILASATVHFRNPATVADKLIVRVRVAEFGNKSFRMEYEISNGATEDLVADGSTVLVMYDYDANASIPVPDDVKKKVQGFENSVFVRA